MPTPNSSIKLITKANWQYLLGVLGLAKGCRWETSQWRQKKIPHLECTSSQGSLKLGLPRVHWGKGIYNSRKTSQVEGDNQRPTPIQIKIYRGIQTSHHKEIKYLPSSSKSHHPIILLWNPILKGKKRFVKLDVWVHTKMV